MSGVAIVHAKNRSVSAGSTYSDSPSSEMTAAMASRPARTPGFVARAGSPVTAAARAGSRPSPGSAIAAASA